MGHITLFHSATIYVEWHIRTSIPDDGPLWPKYVVDQIGDFEEWPVTLHYRF